jgi:murein DD-endopeptidase MepM/ murein hydrolase activator NlpD
MARLPTRDDLGQRPVPQSRRGVASNPAAGAIGEAIGGFGGEMLRIGQQRLAQDREKEDRLAFASARSQVLAADIEARRELENDQDYSTFDARYTEKMKAARTAAAETIRSTADRKLFELDAATDVERGRSEVLKTARGMEVTARKASLFDGLESLRDTGREASDDATRTATLETAKELIAGAQKDGIVDPLSATQLREGWAGDYATDQVTLALNREDPVAAAKLLEQYGDMIPWERRNALEARTKGVLNVREASDIVDGIMGAATKAEGSAVVYGDPLRGKGRGPVVGGQFGASRDYGSHKGVDFPAAKGTAVYATAQGTAHVSRSEKGGNIVTVTAADGSQWKYMHLGAVKVQDGDTVTPDTVVGSVGTSGRSTGPHLHVEVWRGGKPVDPKAVIGKAEQSPQRHDLNQIYAQIDARADVEGWTPEKRERVKQEADRRVGRDELLAGRKDREQMRSALDTVDRLGDGFTDPSQIPNYGSLAPDDRIQLRNMADANRRALAKAVPANGDVAITMRVLAAREPETFAATDLRVIRPFVTPSEFESLAVDQAKMITDRGKPSATASVRSEIDSAITYHNRITGLALDLKTDEGRRQYGSMSDLMRAHVERTTEGKRKPTDDELKAAYDYATMKVVVVDRTSPGVLWNSQGPAETRLYAKQGGEHIKFAIPNDVRSRIITGLAALGVPNPTDDQIGAAYLKGKGRPGLWK